MASPPQPQGNFSWPAAKQIAGANIGDANGSDKRFKEAGFQAIILLKSVFWRYLSISKKISFCFSRAKGFAGIVKG
jgi:hypothetical protein